MDLYYVEHGLFVLSTIYSTTPLSRTLKGPKKMVRLNGSLTYPNFTLSRTFAIYSDLSRILRKKDKAN